MIFLSNCTTTNAKTKKQALRVVTNPSKREETYSQGEINVREEYEDNAAQQGPQINARGE